MQTLDKFFKSLSVYYQYTDREPVDNIVVKSHKRRFDNAFREGEDPALPAKRRVEEWICKHSALLTGPPIPVPPMYIDQLRRRQTYNCEYNATISALLSKLTPQQIPVMNSDVLRCILSLLDIRAIRAFRRTCKRFRDLCASYIQGVRLTNFNAARLTQCVANGTFPALKQVTVNCSCNQWQNFLNTCKHLRLTYVLKECTNPISEPIDVYGSDVELHSNFYHVAYGRLNLEDVGVFTLSSYVGFSYKYNISVSACIVNMWLNEKFRLCLTDVIGYHYAVLSKEPIRDFSWLSGFPRGVYCQKSVKDRMENTSGVEIHEFE